LIQLRSVSKTYPLYDRAVDRLLDALPSVHRPHHLFHALSDIDLAVNPGESFAVIGPNGCGKSTLLQVIAGIVAPSSGEVQVKGRVAALLELGAGFSPDFTGRENVFLASDLLGRDPAKTRQHLAEIESFAGIGEFFDRPVREYSTGMYVRLAFAVAIHAEPEILLVDEALAVGDARFSNKCVRRLEEIRNRGATIVFVSHDLGLVKRLANRAAYLENGRIVCQGEPAFVTNRYVASVLDPNSQGEPISDVARHGDQASTIESAEILDSAGSPVLAVRSGDDITIVVRLRFRNEAHNPMVGILIRNRLGMDIYGTNTRIEGLALGSFSPGERGIVRFRLKCALTRQTYTLTVASQHDSGLSQDWRDDILSFTVHDNRDLAGVANLAAAVSFERC
jgi:lipopolysaccharide transport system ATP-binding protein